jgi:hypothetical protein
MTAATLLTDRQQTLDAVLLRLRALEQERQQLVMNQLRLEGAVDALRLVLEASQEPDGAGEPDEAARLSTALVERADTWQARPGPMPWEVETP